MSIEVKLGDRIAKVKLIEKNNNQVKVMVDDILYNIDITTVEKGVYSILHNNNSINLEMIQGKDSRHYSVNTLYNSYNIEIIDEQTRYFLNRSKHDLSHSNTISTPMPGKVVKIPVKVGDKLKAGETAIVVEAMKMQSEYKVTKDCIVSNILVKQGETVVGDQVLIELEQ